MIEHRHDAVWRSSEVRAVKRQMNRRDRRQCNAAQHLAVRLIRSGRR